jgi:hypothetical protein
MRRLLFVLIAAASVSACIPSDDHDHVTSVNEVEPNDASGQATDLGQPGSYLFFGECLPNESADWFKVTSSGGRVDGSIHVTPPPASGGVESDAAHPVDFYLRDASTNTFAQAMGVTDATVTGDATAETIYVQVGCPSAAVAGTNGTFYFGTLRVP